jgi:hypothetical protein
MYIDVYFAGQLPVDRDDVEDALASLDGFEVVGAGGGEAGSNIDLEVDDTVDRDSALRAIGQLLRELEIADMSHVRVSDTGERLAGADLPH